MTSIKQELNRLKQRAKIAALTLSALTLAQNASAQMTQNEDAQKSKTELNAKKLTQASSQKQNSDNLQQYFYQDGKDGGIAIEAKDLAKGLKAAGITGNSAESEKFINTYINHLNEEGEITFFNLNKVLAETLKPEQIKPFCESLLQSFKDRENGVEKAAPENQQASDIKTIKTKLGTIKYAVEENRVIVNGNLSISVSHLLPPMYIMKNKQYKCGSSQSFRREMAQRMEEVRIRKTIMDHYVYNDIMEHGGPKTPGAKVFMEQHQKNMEKHGLGIDKEGNFYQKAKANNVRQASRSQGR